MASLSLELDEHALAELAARVSALISDQGTASSLESFLDVEGAAEFLACPKSRIYALVSARRLPHHRDGTRLLFDRAELREYVAAGGSSAALIAVGETES